MEMLEREEELNEEEEEFEEVEELGWSLQRITAVASRGRGLVPGTNKRLATMKTTSTTLTRPSSTSPALWMRLVSTKCRYCCSIYKFNTSDKHCKEELSIN
jgi:hypothetical protein